MRPNTNILRSHFFELFFPRRCAGCGVFDEELCASCIAKLELSSFSCLFCGNENNDGRTCGRCKKIFFLDGLCSAASYHDPLARTVIAAFKYRNHRALTASLASLMCHKGLPAGDILMPIPLARTRQGERGYNQAELLARELAKIASIPVLDPPLLYKIRGTPQQAKALSRKQRFEQIKNAFALRKGVNALIAGKRIILVDDVATSGATLNEAARVLKEGAGDGAPGAISVWGWVFAHG